jgi:CheY-like chemotaxis protein
MNKETLNRVFDPFFSTKPVGKGTGLGLAVVHGIVTAHGGEIQIDSQPSIGTTVTVFLPLAEAYSQSVNLEQSTGEIVRGSERILVLDDEPTIVAVIQQALTGWGFEVEGYTDPVVALEIMREAPEKFDLIVTDLTMPHLTGLEFVHALRESIPNLKVIMISGSGVPISKQQLTRLGISTSMAKPLDLVQLGYTIRTLLDG